MSDIGHHAQVSSTRTRRLIGFFSLDLDRTLISRTGSLAHGVGECLQVIDTGLQCIGVRGDPHDLPAFGSGQSITVHLAKVVTVRFGVGRQRADHCS